MTPRLSNVDHGESRVQERPRPWSSLRYRDFRLIFAGQVTSQLGTWMQFTSLTYLLGITLAHSAAHGAQNLALLGASQALPAFLVSPIAGVIADRYQKKRILILVASSRALFALALAFVSQTDTPWTLPLALLLGACFTAAQSVEFPTRQSWLQVIVPRHLLSNAIGLSAIGQNLPLMVGPALAGILIGTVGVYASFYVNAVAQCAVLVAVFFTAAPPISKSAREPMFAQIVGGIRFLISHEVLRWVILALVVASIFVRPYNLLLAAFAGHVLYVDAKAYGTMLAMGGIGTLAGAFTTAVWQSDRRGRLWAISGIMSAIGLPFLAYTHAFWIVLVLLASLGWGSMTFTSSSNVLIQTLSPDEMRGRGLAFYAMLLLGLSPVGTLIMGYIASFVGLQIVYALGGGIGVAFVAWVWVAHPAVRRT